MDNKNKTQYIKDLPGKTIKVIRDFNAPVATVWKAWTDSALLEQWWAPRPWKAKTKVMDFREGGHWHYAMVSQEGQDVWATFSYQTIHTPEYFTAVDNFCDEAGNLNTDFASNHWKIHFLHSDHGTRVETEITYASAEDLNKMMDMGFKEGFAMAHDNLDELLSELKSHNL